jgi:hypothetical protein
MIELYDKDGKLLGAGAKVVVPDGGKLKVPMIMADNGGPDIAALTRQAMADAPVPIALTGHRSGFATVLSDADRDAREKALAARSDRLQDAWKQPPATDPALTNKPFVTKPTGDATAIRDQALANRNRRLAEAWRS